MDRRSSSDSDSSDSSVPRLTDAEHIAIEALACELARIWANNEQLVMQNDELSARSELTAQILDALKRADSSK